MSLPVLPYRHSTIRILLGFLLTVFTFVPAFAQGGALDSTLTADLLSDGGRVLGVAVQSDGKVVIVGSFTNVGGVSRNNIARLNADGTLDTSFVVGSGADNSLNAVVLQPDGKILIAGFLGSYNGVSRNGVARLNSDGSLDTTFNPGLGAGGGLFAVAVGPDGKVAVGGFFTSFGGQARNNVARMNADGTLDTTFTTNPGPDSGVLALAIQADNKILVGGFLRRIDGVSRESFGRLNVNGSLDTSFVVGAGANDVVNVITVQPDQKILIGGFFTSYNSAARAYLARVNSDGSVDSGFTIGTGFNDGVSGIFVQSNGQLLVSGSFTSFNGTARSLLARLNSGGSLDTGFAPATVAGQGGSLVYGVGQLPSGKVIAGGLFSSVGGSPRAGLALFNADGTLDPANPGAQNRGSAESVAIRSDGKIMIGGNFASVNGTSRNFVARLNSDGTVDTGFAPASGANASVLAVLPLADGKTIIGGEFTTYTGTAYARLARLNADGTLDTTFSTPTGANGVVRGLALQSDGKIIAVGEFTSVNGTAALRVVRLNANGTVDTSFATTNGASNTVRSVAIQSDGKVLIGGDFTSYGGLTRNRIARLNTDGTLDTGFAPTGGANDSVQAIALQADGKVVVGGNFTQIAGFSSSRVARLLDNGAYDSGFSVSANQSVTSLVIRSDGRIVIGGNFTSLNSVFRGRVGRVNADGTLDINFVTNPGANERVASIAVASDGKTVIGGAFSSFNNTTRFGVARLTELACSFSLAPTSANFTAAGGPGSTVLTVSDANCQWTVTGVPEWITGLPTSGSGTTTFNYTVAANTGPQRSAIITIGGQTYTVIQADGCTYSIDPMAALFNANGGTGSVNVTAGQRCGWTAVSNVPWLSVTNSGVGSGNGTADYSVEPNAGPQRVGTITIAGFTFTVTQSSGCDFTIDPNAATAPAGGGTGNVAVTASDSACPWTATSNVAWIMITSGATGTGNGTVSYSVAANSGPQRTGTATIAGKTFTLTQASGCTYSINPTSATAPAGGNTGNVAVTASGTDCPWTATSNVSWITITSGATGTGNGTVGYSVAANTGLERTGTATIAGQTFTVTQANGCTYSINPTSATAVGTGGTGSVTVTASNSACPWTATSNVSWITITSGATGTGNGTVGYSVAANSGLERTGTATIAGQTFTVTQANGCTYSINPTSATAPVGGTTGNVTVTASDSACPWTATSNVAWITITSGATGTGNGSVGYSVAANTGPERTGTATIAGQTFTVTQANGCTYSINPTSATSPAAGRTGSVTVTASNTACPWTATSNVAWITITSGATGTGNGTVGYSVAANTGPERSGTATIAGQTFTLTQANGCTYSINPTSTATGVGGGTGSVAVTASDSACPWTATSNVAWITITSGATGTGNGTVGYSVAANTGSDRTGTATIAGQTFTVTQTSGCAFSINPTSATAVAAGTTGSVTVTASDSACPWTATSNVAWITITSGATGTGNGTVGYSVAANTGLERTGTATIAGQTFTVTQANGCTYSINPTAATAAAAGGTGSVAVTASNTACPWTATSNVAWITITSGATGTGNGTVGYSVAANTGPQRSGTATIAGQTFTLTQAGGCTYAINPTEATAAAAGGTGNVAVTASDTACPWTATSNVSWITVTSGATGTGNGTVGYSVAANTGPQRSGTVTIAGQTFTLTQANGCTYSINPTEATAAAAGGTGSVAVTASDTACPWTATSNVAWITITSGATGTGNGTVGYSVAANTGPERSGTVTIAGQTFTLTQANGCTYSINPTSTSIVAGGGTGTVTVTASDSACPWTATSNVAWITITSGATGTGNGTVGYSVSANTGPDRTGTATIAGQTFTVTQVTSCTFNVSPTTIPLPAIGGTTAIGVTAPTGCAWTATSNVPWITITSGATGSGNGTVQISVASNGGVPRSGTLTVAGQTVTVNQSARNAATPGQYRPSNGFVYVRNSNDTGFANVEFFYGTASDIPIAGDWNGDGVDTVGIFRNGEFFLRNSNDTGFADINFAFGAPGDLPIAGDWDGDGVDTIGLVRGNLIFLRNSNSTGVPDIVLVYGNGTDIYIAGDWNGDGIDTIGAFRPTNGFVYLRNSNTSGVAEVEFFYGIAGDKPVAGDWNGDGIDTIGIVRGNGWFLRNSNDTGFADIAFTYGTPTDVPIVGDWNGQP